MTRLLRRFIPAWAGNTLPVAVRGRIHSFRFIPAWAGNTLRHHGLTGLDTVHPRVGGEHSTKSESNEPRSGSSPRGRGTRMLQGTFVAAIRPVHPRVGGEHY